MKIKTKNTFLLAVFLFLFPPAVPCESPVIKKPVPSETRQTVLEGLKKLRQEIQTFEADFAEARTIPGLEIPLNYTGKIYYQKDGIFFMKYITPFEHILRVQNSEALLYVIGSSTADLVSMGATNGIAGNTDLFAMDLTGFSGQILENEVHYMLIKDRPPSQKSETEPDMTLFLDKKNLLFSRIQFQDASGNRTVIQLENVKTNKALPEIIASFSLPEGVKINRLSQ